MSPYFDYFQVCSDYFFVCSVALLLQQLWHAKHIIFAVATIITCRTYNFGTCWTYKISRFVLLVINDSKRVLFFLIRPDIRHLFLWFCFVIIRLDIPHHFLFHLYFFLVTGKCFFINNLVFTIIVTLSIVFIVPSLCVRISQSYSSTMKFVFVMWKNFSVILINDKVFFVETFALNFPLSNFVVVTIHACNFWVRYMKF